MPTNCNTCVQKSIDSCPDEITIEFVLGARLAGQTIWYTYTDKHDESVTDSAVISTTGDASGWGHITFTLSDSEKAKFITGATIVFTLSDTDGGDVIAIDCTGVVYDCVAVYISGDTSAGTEIVEFDCPCGYTVEDVPANEVTLCERVDDCLGISAAGSATKYLNEQGDWTTPTASVAWGGITGTLSAQTDLQSALDAKQNALGYTAENTANKTDTVIGNEASSTKYPSVKGLYDWSTSVFQTLSVEVTGSLTASNDKYYINTATATYTDPTPAAGHGFIVLVRNGTATVGGTPYATAGTLLYRYYHSGAWATYQYSAPETVNTIGALINGASAAVPNDTDEIAIADSSVLKKLTWANLKSTLLTYLRTALAYDRIIGQTTTQVTVASASGETKVYSALVSGNTFKTNSVLHIEGMMTASGAATITMRWYANTSDSLSGATLLGTYQATARFNMVRNIIMNNSLTAQKMMLSASGTASPTDEGVSASGLTMATVAVDFTANQYIIVSVQASANNALLEYASIKEHRP